MFLRLFTCVVCGLIAGRLSAAEPQLSIQKELVHLRSAAVREWSEFPEQADAEQLERRFAAAPNAQEMVLCLRQIDVKQAWRVVLNGKRLGELVRDENDMLVNFAVPPLTLKADGNELRIEPTSRMPQTSDDIRVGDIRLEAESLQTRLQAGQLEVTVVDADSLEPLPARITVLDSQGSLVSVGAASNDEIAVRPGTIFTAHGRAQFSLPVGHWTLLAGRGFEYSLAREVVDVARDQKVTRTLKIRREVPTSGRVACDTHVHTLTHSGHGDATIQERLITLAAEGIELPVAADHNKHIDLDPVARQLNVRRYMTPVVGNEVTTSVGHFNIFPIPPGARVADHKQPTWAGIFQEIFETTQAPIAILNHARDLHSGVRPFGPKLHHALIGENLEGWPMRFNAMEVVNSGATQSQPLQLFQDWMNLLNRGLQVTPVGSSDSHDVARHFVGQGRTYIRVDDRDPGQIDVAAAVKSFLEGRVEVSYGLLAELVVNDTFRSGDLAAVSDKDVRVTARVLAPHWIEASHVRLYANGQLIREEPIEGPTVTAAGRTTATPQSPAVDLPIGVKWSRTWTLPRPSHDQHLVLIAVGPGVSGSHWKTAKPYQPTSPDWTAQVIGCSGAIWLDANSDGRKSSARELAAPLVQRAAGDTAVLLKSLAPFDAAVAQQAAYLHQVAGTDWQSEAARTALNAAPESLRTAILNFITASRDIEIARQAIPRTQD